MIKVIFALIAVGSNAVCVWIVIKRQQATKVGIEAVIAESERLDKLGAPLISSWLIALSIGSYLWLGA